MRTIALPVMLLIGSCVSHKDSPTAGLVTTINVNLSAPDPGSPGAPNVIQDATFSLTALDDQGNLFPGDAIVDIYISSGGVLTGIEAACGDKSDTPIETLTVHGGTLNNHSLKLPVAYGITAIWAEERGSHAVGSSIPIYFANPTIPNIQTPPDPSAQNATYCTNFEKKFITVDTATNGGELLIESVFGGAVTVTDTGATDYRSLYLFTFGRPDATLVPGRHVTSFSGNVSKFVGFTEVNFPIINADLDLPIEADKLPAPIVLTSNDISDLVKLTKANSSVVQLTAKVCSTTPPNPNNDPYVQDTITEWIKYDTFILATNSCDSNTEFSVQLPSKVVGNFDPTQIVGQSITVTGMLKNSSGQKLTTDANGNPIACKATTDCTPTSSSSTCVQGQCMNAPYNFWTIVVRDSSDVPQH